MPRGRIELPTPASSEANPDYLIIQPQNCGRSWALTRGYCWDSLVSLYTFQGTYALPGLARDYPWISYPRISPEFTQLFNPDYSGRPRRIQGCALPMSYLGIFIIVQKIAIPAISGK